jgi:hypothetical protein
MTLAFSTRTDASRRFPSCRVSFDATSLHHQPISGTLHRPLWGTFQLSVTLLLRYRSQDVFSLGSWCLPNFREISDPRYSRRGSNIVSLHLRGYHTLRRAVPGNFNFTNNAVLSQAYNTTSPRRDSVWALPLSLAVTDGISI